MPNCELLRFNELAVHNAPGSVGDFLLFAVINHTGILCCKQDQVLVGFSDSFCPSLLPFILATEAAPERLPVELP